MTHCYIVNTPKPVKQREWNCQALLMKRDKWDVGVDGLHPFWIFCCSHALNIACVNWSLSLRSAHSHTTVESWICVLSLQKRSWGWWLSSNRRGSERCVPSISWTHLRVINRANNRKWFNCYGVHKTVYLIEHWHWEITWSCVRFVMEMEGGCAWELKLPCEIGFNGNTSTI